MCPFLWVAYFRTLRKQIYLENLRNSGAGQLLQMLDKLENIAGGLSGIREVLRRE
jgi:hypothetical protein